MFKRGDVVQHKVKQWIGVMLGEPIYDGEPIYARLFADANGAVNIDSNIDLRPVELIEDTDEIVPIDGYEFVAALALGDTATALRLYREVQEGEDAAQGALDAVTQQLGEKTQQLRNTEANERRLQAAINVIGQHLANSTDEVVRELTGEKPYFMPGIITAVQFLVNAHTKLQTALSPFAAYGKLKRLYPDEAVFTIAYDRDGDAVKILFSDFTRAAAAHPDARANTHATPTSGGAGGIAEIMEDHRPQTLFGKPIVYTELTDAAKVDGKILRVIPPGEVTIKPRFKKPAFGYRVQYVAQDGLTRIGRIGADSDEEALQVFAEMVSGATDLKVVWSIPLTDADGSVW